MRYEGLRWYNFNMITQQQKIIQDGFNWVITDNPGLLNSNIYCQTRDVFQARMSHLLVELQQKIKNNNLAFLLTAIIGEIGNNSFDHNLGNWRDIAGIYFAYDFFKHLIVMADRGQGVLRTIKKVKPGVSTDGEALKVAFTETISGRSPEQRGNGLKFVRKVVCENNLELNFYSGQALCLINSKQMEIKREENNIKGTIAIIKF